MLRVLIVEDEPLIAIHLEDILLSAGHQVVGIAANMSTALALAEGSPDVDVAIMDIDLSSRPDGIEAARRLRLEFGIESLFVSAHLTEANVQRAKALDPVGIIDKPFLDEQIAVALAKSEANRRPLGDRAARQLTQALELGREAGRDAAAHAGICPWTQDGRRDLRRIWLTGFAEGRAQSRSAAF